MQPVWALKAFGFYVWVAPKNRQKLKHRNIFNLRITVEIFYKCLNLSTSHNKKYFAKMKHSQSQGLRTFILGITHIPVKKKTKGYARVSVPHCTLNFIMFRTYMAQPEEGNLKQVGLQLVLGIHGRRQSLYHHLICLITWHLSHKKFFFLNISVRIEFPALSVINKSHISHSPPHDLSFISSQLTTMNQACFQEGGVFGSVQGHY